MGVPALSLRAWEPTKLAQAHGEELRDISIEMESQPTNTAMRGAMCEVTLKEIASLMKEGNVELVRHVDWGAATGSAEP